MSKPSPPAPTASAVGPCPTIIQIVGRPGTGSLPRVIAPPDHPHLSTLPISVLRSLDTEANKFYDRTNRLYDAALLTRCYTQHALRPVIDSKIDHISILSKFLLLIKVWTLLIYRAFSEINRYSHPYQITSRTVTYQSFVINIISLLGALYLISINLFLILISKLVPLTLELARTLNMFIQLQVMLLQAI